MAAAAQAEFERLRAEYAQVSVAEQNRQQSMRQFPYPDRLSGASHCALWRMVIGLSGGAREEGVHPLDVSAVAAYAGLTVEDVQTYKLAVRADRIRRMGRSK